MKNIILYLGSLLLSSSVIAQSGGVGINTSSPQQVLHIDAAKNTVGNANTSDDVVVTSQGYMGIGTIAPSKRLEINSATPKAIKIMDGTQKQNSFLMSNTNGVGTWYQQGSVKPVILGTWPSTVTTIVSNNKGGTQYSNVFITLTPGLWVVNFGATFKMGNVADPFWLHLYLSDSTTGRTNTSFDFLGAGGNSTGYAGLMIPNKSLGVGNANLLSGSSVIRVKQDTTLYVLVENLHSDTPIINWNFTTSNWENYFYATPLDGN